MKTFILQVALSCLQANKTSQECTSVRYVVEKEIKYRFILRKFILIQHICFQNHKILYTPKLIVKNKIEFL